MITTTTSFPFWLVTSFEYESIDEQSGEIQFKIFTKWWWRSQNKLETTDNAEGGKVFQKEAESDCFPVNPSNPFQNLTILEAISMLSKAQSTELYESNDKLKYLNFAQKVYRAKLCTPLDMRCFPFDRHLVPAVLSVRQWFTTTIDGKGTLKHKWDLLTERPDEWFAPGEKVYAEDRSTVNLIGSGSDNLHELKKLIEPEVQITVEKDAVDNEVKKVGKPILCLKLERDPSSFYANVVIPTFIIVAIVLMSLFSKDGGSIDGIATGILSLVASQLALQEKLPKKVYVTFAGLYLIFSYIFLFMLGIALIATQNATGDTSSGASLLSAHVFVAIWVVPHIFVVLDYVGLPFLRNIMRNSWGELDVSRGTAKHGSYKEIVSIA